MIDELQVGNGVGEKVVCNRVHAKRARIHHNNNAHKQEKKKGEVMIDEMCILDKLALEKVEE